MHTGRVIPAQAGIHLSDNELSGGGIDAEAGSFRIVLAAGWVPAFARTTRYKRFG